MTMTTKDYIKLHVPIVNIQKTLFVIVATGINSGLVHGYNFILIVATKDTMKRWISQVAPYIQFEQIGKDVHQHLNAMPYFYSVLDGSYALGGAVGSLFILYFGTEFGRRGGMLMTAFIGVFASLFTGYSKYFGTCYLLLTGRFLFGFQSGINSALAPLYLYEISPKDSNGQLALLYGVFMGIGGLLGIVCGKYLGNDRFWPLLHSLSVIPAIITLAILPLCPESPKYLYGVRGKMLECKKALEWLRESKYVEGEMLAIRGDYLQRQAIGKIRLKHVLGNVILRQALLLTIIMNLSQQLCGLSMTFTYVTGMFNDTISDERVRLMMTMVIFATMFLSSLVTFLFFSQVCRRKIYLISFIGLSISSGTLCVLSVVPKFNNWNSLIFLNVLVYFVLYRFGPGAFIWITAAELFNAAAAPIAYTFGLFINWIMRAVMIFYFRPYTQLVGGYGFLNFVISNAFFAYFTYRRMPHIIGKSLKEIYKEMYGVGYRQEN